MLNKIIIVIIMNMQLPNQTNNTHKEQLARINCGRRVDHFRLQLVDGVQLQVEKTEHKPASLTHQRDSWP